MSIAEQLATHLDIPEKEVASTLQLAPLRYRVFHIPKRTYGTRTIAQPSRALKVLQRAFLEIRELPVHASATAYQKGSGIKLNAGLHVRNPYLLKMDLHSFFHSITPAVFW
ncbi:MAG TPA: RNA-directed DNA polymerase, partial [Burkholderiaceae bacterium]|nr:RNA-directed DNA polymerase [Burkholderiaceae bacterium]